MFMFLAIFFLNSYALYMFYLVLSRMESEIYRLLRQVGHLYKQETLNKQALRLKKLRKEIGEEDQEPKNKTLGHSKTQVPEPESKNEAGDQESQETLSNQKEEASSDEESDAKLDETLSELFQEAERKFEYDLKYFKRNLEGKGLFEANAHAKSLGFHIKILYVKNGPKKPLTDYEKTIDPNKIVGVKIYDPDYDFRFDTFSHLAKVFKVIDIGGVDPEHIGMHLDKFE